MSNFEIDGSANFVQDDGSPSIDWLLPDKATTRGTIQPDKVNGTGDNSLGKGTSEDDPVPSLTTDSIPPNKSDLLAFGSYQETGVSSSYLHLLWTRVQDPSGSTNMDFEFDQARTLSSNGVTPLRTAGDLLIEYHLANGGSSVTLTKRLWGGSSWNASQALAGNAIGAINSSAILAADAGPFGAKSARTFGEASIDLATIFPAGTCESFGYSYLKSRSSDSFSSEIKDFTTPAPVNVTNCGTVNSHKQDELGAPLSGAVFTLYNNAAPLTAPRTNLDTVTSPALTCTTTLPSGDCSIVNVPFGNYWVVETTTPPNHDTAPDQAVTLAPSGNTPAGTLTFVDPRQVGSIIVKKNDANGVALAGAGFTITPGNIVMSPVAGSPGLFCTDQLPYAQYTVTETTVPFGYTGASAQSTTVSTKTTCAARLASTVVPDLTFVNNPVLGTINVLKTDDATPGNPLGGAQFTLYKDVGTIGTYGAGDTVVQAGPNTTGTAGTTQFTNVPLGSYCVVETFTPLTYDTAPPQCMTIAPAANGQVSNLTFVDRRQRGSILVRKEDGDHVALAGAGFTVSQGAASFGTMSQPSTGVFCLDGLLTGTYTVTESTVPVGYAGTGPKTFAVSGNSTCLARLAGTVTPDLTFVNRPVPGIITLTKRDDAGNVLANAGFTLFQDAGTLGTYEPLVDTVVQAGPSPTDATGTLSFTDVPLGNYCLVETSTPATYDTAAPQCVTVFLGSAAGRGSTLAVTFVDRRQRGSILVEKVDGDGVALAGAGFTVSQGATSTGTMNELSTGIFCLDGLLTGTYSVTESTVPVGYAGQGPSAFAVSGNSTCVARIAGTVIPDLTFVNTPVLGRINLTKRDDAGNLLANAGFTLYRDAGTIGSYEPLVDTGVQAGPLSTSSSGTLSFTDVPLGNYCVVETGTPTAYNTAPAQCVTVFLGSTAGTGSTLGLSFEDPRKHTVIVIVCHQGTNTLDSSPVTLGASTKDSLASAPSGVTEAQLCGLGGATYSVDVHGVKGLSVDVR